MTLMCVRSLLFGLVGCHGGGIGGRMAKSMSEKGRRKTLVAIVGWRENPGGKGMDWRGVANDNGK